MKSNKTKHKKRIKLDYITTQKATNDNLKNSYENTFISLFKRNFIFYETNQIELIKWGIT